DGPYASYNASKAGLLGLSRTMALELGPHGVRVNCVSPGFTHTEMTEVGVPPGTMDYLTTRFDRVPMRRLVRPEEIAAACAFLASDDASAITGIDLTVDCGPSSSRATPSGSSCCRTRARRSTASSISSRVSTCSSTVRGGCDRRARRR